MGGGISWRRSAGTGYRLAALGFVPARTGDGGGGEEHEDFSREQTKSAGRERDQFAWARAVRRFSPILWGGVDGCAVFRSGGDNARHLDRTCPSSVRWPACCGGLRGDERQGRAPMGRPRSGFFW